MSRPRSPRSRRNIIRKSEDSQRELITVLLESNEPAWRNLADRLYRCQRAREARRGWDNFLKAPSDNYPYRCRLFACEVGCRSSIARQWREAAWRRFANAENRSCSMVSILLAHTTQVAAIRDIVAKARKDLSNMRARMYRRSAGRHWRTVDAFGMVEIDVAAAGGGAMLALGQRALHPNASQIRSGNAGSWSVRAHIAVHHPHLDRPELARALVRQWRGVERVIVQAFDQHRSAADNAVDTVSNSLNEIIQDGFRERGLGESPCWHAEYHSWLFSLKRGLQPLSISLRPQQTNGVPGMENAVEGGDAQNIGTSGGWHHDEIEPMPFVF